jgi:hypothetical protein
MASHPIVHGQPVRPATIALPPRSPRRISAPPQRRTRCAADRCSREGDRIDGALAPADAGRRSRAPDRPYDIDRLISQAVLAGVTQAGTLAVAGSTLLAFAAAQPAWRRIRRIVDRRFDRAQVDAARAAVAFSDRQRDAEID